MAMIDAPAVGRLCDVLVEESARFARMLADVIDPARPAIGVWNISETAAHVAGSAAYLLAAARGDAKLIMLDDLDAAHAQQLAEDPERDPTVLARRLEEGVAELVAYARDLEDDPVVEAFAGVPVPFSTVLGIEVGEKLVHGFDIARAAQLPWRIDPAHAALTLDALLPIMPFIVDADRAAGVRLRFELVIRGGGRHVLVVEHGALRVEQPSAVPLDFRVSADPAAYLLLTFNRVNPLILMLRGKVVTWGRRPWQARRLQSVLKRV